MATASSNTALLVVHIQPDIVSEGTAFGNLFHEQVTANNIIDACNRAMSAVRNAGGLVVPLRIAFKNDYSDLDPSMPLLQMVAEAGCLKDGSREAALHPDLVVEEGDHQLAHQRPGPFTDTDLDEVLRARGVTDVIVCGVATNASVEGAVRQAADLGYSTYVLSDASSAADSEAHQASLASMGLFAQSLEVAEL